MNRHLTMACGILAIWAIAALSVEAQVKPMPTYSGTYEISDEALQELEMRIIEWNKVVNQFDETANKLNHLVKE